MEGFMRQKIYGENMARSTMADIGHPSEAYYNDMICSNMISHCPVTPADIDTANKIFVCDISSLKVKTVRRQPSTVVSEYVEIPRKIKHMNRRMTVSAGVMFVSGITFLVSVYRGLKSTTVEYTSNRTATVLSK